MQKLLGKIKREDYWEWRFTISEMRLADERYNNGNLLLKILEKEHEIQKYKLQLQSAKVKELKEVINSAKAEYEKVKQRLEQELNCSLNGCVIDDVTLEVMQLEEPNNNQKE